MNVSNLEVLAVALHRRWRKDWRVRLGIETPPVNPGSVWIHGASIGECVAATALAKQLSGPVLITADTPEGKRVAEQKLKGVSHVVVSIRPADHPWTLAPLWAEARPRGLVFVEGGWWPELAAIAARAGVPVLRVSAKAGPRTRRYGPWLGYRRWTRHATFVDARDRSAADWFAKHQDAPVSCTGDLKVDVAQAGEGVAWGRPFVVGACTHQGEESFLLDAVEEARRDHGLLLAPRDVSRAPALLKWLRGRGVPCLFASSLEGEEVPPEVSVVLLDSYGALSPSLRGAAAVFVGGTFNPRVGGHSPVEAWRAGAPIVTGPHTWAHESAFTDAGAWAASSPERLAEGLLQAVAPPLIQTGVAAHLGAEVESRCVAWAPECSPRPWARRGVGVWGWLVRRRASPQRFEGLPVVAVGSENGRGAGKTTTGRWVARELARRGYRVGVVARGYKRQHGRGALLHQPGMPGVQLGDDAALYAMDGHVVATGAQRMEACRLVREAGADIVVLEDGLQQGQVCPDWSVAVIDADFPNARGAMPEGERRPRLRDADVTLCLNGQLEAPVIEGTVSRRWYCGGQAGTPPDDLAVFVGTGRPGVVRSAMSHRVNRFHWLGDHGRVDARKWRGLQRWAGEIPLACTAKDYVRIQHHPGTAEVWWLEQTAAFEEPDLVLPPSRFPGGEGARDSGPEATALREGP